MKKLITYIVSLSMAMIVLVSTMSFTVNIRYCDENVVATTLNSNDDPCSTNDLKTLEDCCIPQKDCCQDTEIVFDGHEELRIQISKEIKIQKALLYALLVDPFYPLYKVALSKHLQYTNYAPPIIIRDRQLIHQVFLI
ncbi:MAG: hypothetical protein COB98_00545 [Flavobacteriaceae bacterium]|nr:MAG: hypothetical protein COB98_00545 [Flavobacteriaceae bacterium]